MTGEEEERELLEQATRCAESGNATHWPTAAGYLADEVKRLRAKVKQLELQLRGYEAGAEAYDEAAKWGEKLTLAQMWHKLLNATPDQRQMLMLQIYENADAATQCFTMNHKGRLGEAEELRRSLSHAVFGEVTGDSVQQLTVAVRALRKVMVDGIAARTQVLTDADYPADLLADEPESFPTDADVKDKIAEQLKNAGIDTQSICAYEWSTAQGVLDPSICYDHACGRVNPLHVESHECANCGARLDHETAERLAMEAAEAGR